MAFFMFQSEHKAIVLGLSCLFVCTICWILWMKAVLQCSVDCMLPSLQYTVMGSCAIWLEYSADLCFQSYCPFLWTFIVIPPPFDKERAYCFAHVGWSVWSVCLSVCNLFLFPINNSRTPWPTFLKLCPLWFWGHWVKGQGHRVKCVKIVSDCLSNNFPKWVFSSFICATYFELTYPVLQNICDQKNL